jgi:chorismate mutase-like protein
MTARRTEELLGALRSQLDQLDTQLLKLLSKRFEVCRDVAACKARHGIPMMQPERIARVKGRMIELGAQYGVNENFIVRLFEVIITEACRMENSIIQRNGGDDRAIEA